MDVRTPNGISAVELLARNQAAQETAEETPLLESHNPAMIALLETAKRAAAGDTTILLTGESGTGNGRSRAADSSVESEA
jgi:two-component system, NtrC family, response regulator AlgB